MEYFLFFVIFFHFLLTKTNLLIIFDNKKMNWKMIVIMKKFNLKMSPLWDAWNKQFG